MHYWKHKGSAEFSACVIINIMIKGLAGPKLVFPGFKVQESEIQEL